MSQVQLHDAQKHILCVIYDDFASKTAELLQKHDWIARATLVSWNGKSVEIGERFRILKNVVDFDFQETTTKIQHASTQPHP